MCATARFPLVVLMAAAATATACTGNDRCRSAGPTTTFVHPNGLALSLPERFERGGFQLDQRPDGFFLLAGLGYRLGKQVTVQRLPGPAPASAFPKTRMVNGTLTHYRIDRSENPGSSGGEEFELTAWQAAGGDHIFYVEHETGGDWSAWSDPPLCVGWTIIEGTKLSP